MEKKSVVPAFEAAGKLVVAAALTLTLALSGAAFADSKKEESKKSDSKDSKGGKGGDGHEGDGHDGGTSGSASGSSSSGGTSSSSSGGTSGGATGGTSTTGGASGAGTQTMKDIPAPATSDKAPVRSGTGGASSVKPSQKPRPIK